ncbi:MAG TPA: hypothetical protein VM889_10445 [Candidatus Thermoplasmatota archaeon]|jgi:hypothetical protein|nr:hypothetical protein [Candidatus Thermoplasmatota archaeon]
MKPAALVLMLLLPALSGCFGFGRFDAGPLIIQITDLQEWDENRVNATVRLHNAAATPLEDVSISMGPKRLNPSLFTSYSSGYMDPRPSLYFYGRPRDQDVLPGHGYFNHSTTFHYHDPPEPHLPHVGHDFQIWVAYVHDGTKFSYLWHHCLDPNGEALPNTTLCGRKSPLADHRKRIDT